jgi:tRNA(Arg) A34 adenosine deaminase TadA
LEEGNYGVGVALIRDEIVVKIGRNQVFTPHFRSDLHAEMSVLNAYEDEVRGSALIHRDTTLYTSIEPCIMCFARIVNAGIKRVFYAAPEPTGGMNSIRQNLPEAWIKIQSGSGTTFSQADCSKELSQIADEILWSSAETLENTLRNRG